VKVPLVFLLGPSLRGVIEQFQGQLRLTLEHGHQPPLDRREEDFLLAVLLGSLRQRRVVLDRQPLETFARLGGQHG